MTEKYIAFQQNNAINLLVNTISEKQKFIFIQKTKPCTVMNKTGYFLWLVDCFHISLQFALANFRTGALHFSLGRSN